MCFAQGHNTVTEPAVSVIDPQSKNTLPAEPLRSAYTGFSITALLLQFSHIHTCNSLENM